MKIFSDKAPNEKVVEECISAIWSLSLEDENEDLVIESAIPLIVEALQKHKNAEKGTSSLIQ